MSKTSRAVLRPPIKTHGGKRYLRHWLVENLPVGFEEMRYIEPFIGGGSLLLNKPRSRSETINDLDSDLISLWIVLQGHHRELIDLIRGWGYTEEGFRRARDMITPLVFSDDPKEQMDKAIKEYVLRRMSRGGMKKSFAWSDRLRGGKPGDVNAWETMFEVLPRIHSRLAGVDIRHGSALDIVREEIDPGVVFYLDPPYVKSTRYKGAIQVYHHEMSDKDHENLLDACLCSGAKIMISGYQCPLYNGRLKSWNFKFRPVANHSSQCDRKTIKIESLWTNY